MGELIAPLCFARCVRFRCGMAPEIEIDRPVSRLPEACHCRPQLIRLDRRTWERSKPTGLRNRKCQVNSLGAGHRSLDDWKVDTEKLRNFIVGPHRCLA